MPYLQNGLKKPNLQNAKNHRKLSVSKTLWGYITKTGSRKVDVFNLFSPFTSRKIRVLLVIDAENKQATKNEETKAETGQHHASEEQ